jgi:hypothetical protein
MELDDLKQAWKQQAPIDNNKNTDIMELIHHKTYGPLAALKKVYIRQIIAMSVLPFVLILTNLYNVSGVFTSILFWSYTAFCIAVISFASYNYSITKKMEVMDGMVKTNLEQHIELLEKRKRMELRGLRYVALFFVLLLETVPYIQHYRMLDKWHSLNPLIRFGTYATFLIIQYFMNKRISYQKSGRHLEYLKGLVGEMR